MYMYFLCKLRTNPLKHPLLLQKAPCSYKTILTQDTVSREDGIPLKLRVHYGNQVKNSKTYPETYQQTYLIAPVTAKTSATACILS